MNHDKKQNKIADNISYGLLLGLLGILLITTTHPIGNNENINFWIGFLGYIMFFLGTLVFSFGLLGYFIKNREQKY